MELDLLCKQCNERCGQTVDSALVEAFLPFRLRLGVVGDRGQVPRMTIVDADGNRLHLGPAMDVSLAPAAPTIEQSDNSFNVTSPRATAREVIESLRRKHAGKKVEITTTTVTRSFPGPVSFSFAPDERIFRSPAKTALAILEARTDLAASPALTPYWAYAAGGEEPNEASVEWLAEPCPWTPGSLGAVPHRVLVERTEPGLVRAEVSYFGGIGIRLSFGVHPGPPFRHAHGVDPLTKTLADADGWGGDISLRGVSAASATAYVQGMVDRIMEIGAPIETRALILKIAKAILARHGVGVVVAHRGVADAVAREIADEITSILHKIESEYEDPVLRDALSAPKP